MSQHTPEKNKQSPTSSNLNNSPHKRLAAYSHHFRRYELLVEYKNLRNHIPSGIYVMPMEDNLYIWHGVLFLSNGPYRGAVFQFLLLIPDEYPHHRPSVRFLTDMFHPLVNRSGQVSLSHRFPTWQGDKDYIHHLLRYLRDMFQADVLKSDLPKELCPNQDAYQILKEDWQTYLKLAQQTAQISSSDSVVYETFAPDHPIQFRPLTDAQSEQIRRQVNGFTTNTDIQPIDAPSLLSRVSTTISDSWKLLME